MNWHSHSVFIDLWCAQPILQSAVLVILWRRKLHKQFPVFFYFLLAQVLNFAVIFPPMIAGKYELYFWLFWLGEAINAVLGFKVIHEVFLDVFRPYHTLKDLGTLLFNWAGLVMLLVSVVVAFSNSLDQSPLVHAITTLQRSVRIVQLGLILFLLLFSRFLGVSRKQITFGIALGFGLFAGVELMLFALHSGGFITAYNFNLINLVAYILAICVWLGYAFSRNAARLAAINHLQTARWEQGLTDLQQPVPSESLIPMFESMVDRAFSRSSGLESAGHAAAENAAAEHVAAENPAAANGAAGNPPTAADTKKTNSAAVGSKTGQ